MALELSYQVQRTLEAMARRLGRLALTATARAGSGHPSSCLSCAELVAVLFFHVLRFDKDRPEDLHNDRFILSKGHAAPILWAAWAAAGAFPEEQLNELRVMGSELEGHPTPRNRWVDVATGSLGQGLAAGAGMALSARRRRLPSRIYVLLGDGEAAEGSVWEAAELAAYHKLHNLTAIFDVNRLGQSQATMHEWDTGAYASKLEAFGWHALTIDGHSVPQVAAAYEQALAVTDKPTAIIARTVKGKGVSFLENKEGFHGKALDQQQLAQALGELGGEEMPLTLPLRTPERTSQTEVPPRIEIARAPLPYRPGQMVATRKAFGNALVRLGAALPQLVVLDGDVQNSTYSDAFARQFPDRFFQCFIAEQALVGAALGCQVFQDIPCAATFACFLTRAYDFIRMAAIGRANLKLCGSHAGISIGEDGPSQMGLEDIAMMRAIAGSTVLYPADAVAAERLVETALVEPGIVYLRTARPETPVLYGDDEEFPAGGCKILKSSAQDRATIAAAGVTLFEALRAHEELLAAGISTRVIDLYSIKPLPVAALREAVTETGALVVVEDHYPEGGIAEAVAAVTAGEQFAFRSLAVRSVPSSGSREDLMELLGISAAHITRTVQELL